jgi:hypothetical protein
MEAESNGTAQDWRERITSQRASGQSIRAWCRENNHHEHAFYWWRSRLGLSPRLAAKRPQHRPVKPLKFAEVVVDRAAGEAMCLRLGGGRELLLPASMPIESIAKLVRAIEVSA